jgi:hydroxymethylglutaryl-CoA reductase
MVASSRIRLRELDVSGRHELLANETGLDETTFRALLPEHGLTVEQADHMIENAVGVLGIPSSTYAMQLERTLSTPG